MIQISKEDKGKVIMTAKQMGFISREITNYLKTERKVDTYIPARENMDIFKDAVSLAVPTGKWQKHSNKKRKAQEILSAKDYEDLQQF